MTGMVFGSAGVPLSPWHAAQSCAFASISSAACAGGRATTRPSPAPKTTENTRVNMAICPPSRREVYGNDRSISKQPTVSRISQRARVPPLAAKMWQDAVSVDDRRIKGESSQPAITSFLRESLMRNKMILALVATASALVFPIDAVQAEGQAALTGIVSSQAEGKMEGVVVTAHRPGSIVEVSVTTDAEGRYSFPRNRLEPGEYALSIRAVGYDIGSPAKATVATEKVATADIKLKQTKNLAGQLTNAEWMMSIPGTEDQKAGLLNCVGCHTLERVVRSTHDSEEWTHVISRMRGYGAVSQPIKPQPMLDRERAGTPEQFRKLADYLATINLSAVDHWAYELKTLPRPKGRDTRAIVTQYDVVRPTSEPHDVLVDKEGKVWYTDFGEMFIGKFDPKTLKLVEYPVQKFKDKAPTGLLSIEFDRDGKIWFDSMYQGSLGRLDPKDGKIAYFPVPPEYNDDTVQLNFTGLRHDVDGKVWTKTVGTQHIFRLDLATNKWERFHPTDYLPADKVKGASIYQVISDSKNNLWMAEFTDGHLGKIDAKTTKVTWYPLPTANARARRMNIDDQDRIVATGSRRSTPGRRNSRCTTCHPAPIRTGPISTRTAKSGRRPCIPTGSCG